MKRVVIGTILICDMSFAYCLALYNQNPTCSTVASVVSRSLPGLLPNFHLQRQSLVLKPTTTLNTKIIKHNLLNGKVYNEQQAIMNLDNAIAVEMEEQGFLLEKLSKLKELSVKQQELLLKTNQDK